MAEIKSDSFIIKPATPAEYPAIIQLFELSLGNEGGIPSIEFWKWKHEANPFGQSPTILMYDGATLAGLRTFMFWNWELEGKNYKSLRCVDTATHPDYRGKGIFKKLTLQLVEESKKKALADFIFNTPNQMSAPGYLKMGWETAGQTNLFLKPNSRIFKKKLFGYHSEKLPAQLPFTEWTSQAIEPLLMAFRNQHHTVLSTRYTTDYLYWRYRQAPDIQYGNWLKKDASGHISAIFFFRIKETKGLRELRILDAVWSDNSGLKAIMSGIRQTGKQFKTEATSILKDPILPTTFYLKNGFFPFSKKGLLVTKKKLSNESIYQKLQPDTNWNLSAGVIELF